MHTRLPDHLRHIYVLEALKDTKLLHFLHTLFVYKLLLSFLASIVRTEDVMGDTDARFQNCTFDKLVIFQLAIFVLACVNELYDHFSLVVKMSFVVVINFNLALGVLKSANIDTCRSRVLLQEVDETRQVVRQVLGSLQLRKEVCLVFFFLLGSLDLLLRTSLIKCYSLSITFFLVHDGLKLGFPLHTT